MTLRFRYFTILFLTIICLCANRSSVLAEQVTNINYYQITDDTMVIYYDLESENPADISLAVSLDSGITFTLIPEALTGDAGRQIAPGTKKRIVWSIIDDIESLPKDFVIDVVIGMRTSGLLSSPASIAESQVVTVKAKEPIIFDGYINEAVWAGIEPISNFTQRELTEGAAPTEKTEVRITYDDDNLYFGIICYDSEPDKIIHKELKWDGGGVSGQGRFSPVDDMFTFVIDTYNDKRTGLYFAVNPNGAQYDGSFESGDFQINFNWNGIWEVQSRITDYGWTAEIAIPFKTLRFPATDTQEWAINFMRNIRRKNEEVLWQGWGRNDGINRLSKMGTLFINEPLKKSYKLDATPYLLAGIDKEIGENTNDIMKTGIDVKYGITSNTTIDLTTRTDFAQLEDDREVINLTRFDINYPEKRDFFLEGVETFKFSMGRHEELFYSRNIGLTEDREQLPILGGVKLTQKKGSYRLGMLSVQTDAKYGVPSTNYSVFRVKKDVFKQSYVGFIGTSVYDTNQHDNKLYGVDFSYSTDSMFGNNNIEVNGVLASTVTDGDNEKSMAKRLSIYYPNDLIFVYMSYNDIDENFNPELGFMMRTGVKNYMGMFRISPRSNLPLVKKLIFEPANVSFYTDSSGKPLTRDLKVSPLAIEFNSDDRIQFTINNVYEYLDEEFDIFDDVVIPVETYEWLFYEVKYNTSKSKPISLNLKTQWGDFYSGTKQSLELESTFKTSMFYSLSADIKYNSFDVVNRNFITREYGGRIVLDLSTRFSTSTFVQWNNDTREANVNFRLHYMPKVGSDIYLVYNRLMDEENNFRSLYDNGMLKVDYTYRF